MADKDGDGPSLEMPSFGFRRKRKASQPEEPEPPADEVEVQEPVTDEVAEEPVDRPGVEHTQVMDPVEHTPATEPPPLFADEAEAPPATPAPAPAAREDDPQEQTEEVPPEPRRRAARSLPSIRPMAAAVVVGALIGLLLVGLTWGSLHLCELLRGTSACGKPGFFLLVAIVAILVLIGGQLLKVCRVNDPGSTSFLGVGLVAVLTLLFLVQSIFAWWMIIAIPVLGVISFVLATWVSTAFAED